MLAARRSGVGDRRAQHNPLVNTGTPARWDLFCRVIDNLGDAGTAWRLARLLHVEHGCEVVLWIDAPEVLASLARDDTSGSADLAPGLSVRDLDTWNTAAGVGDVIVEVLGAGVPDAYVDALTRRVPLARWLILEYLSAEAWVEDRHRLPSPHPATGAPRTFVFPGFTARTGGLLRERDLLARRDAFLASDSARTGLWETVGVDPAMEDAKRISLFVYPDAPVLPLLNAWSAEAERIVCFVPVGVAQDALATWAEGARVDVNQTLVRGALTVHVIPWLAQERYDELLWACDVNFVRGEDSFVRAQWAARPFVWNIYRQAEDAHTAKLTAFVERYIRALPDDARTAVRRLFMAWNTGQPPDEVAEAWRAFDAVSKPLQSHARSWAAGLAALPELATTLVEAASL